MCLVRFSSCGAISLSPVPSDFLLPVGKKEAQEIHSSGTRAGGHWIGSSAATAAAGVVLPRTTSLSSVQLEEGGAASGLAAASCGGQIRRFGVCVPRLFFHPLAIEQERQLLFFNTVQ